MSRIGKLPIAVPNGITVEKKDKNTIYAKGPKGELSIAIPQNIAVEIKDGQIICSRVSDSRQDRSLHGLSRSLLANMVEGVSKGFEKRLEIQGVGFRANIQGKKIVLNLGFSHPVEFNPPAQINIAIDPEKKNILIITGPDCQVVGEVAAKIRSFRKPEPYKGKGIRYENEVIVRKAGKAAAKEKA